MNNSSLDGFTRMFKSSNHFGPTLLALSRPAEKENGAFVDKVFSIFGGLGQEIWEALHDFHVPELCRDVIALKGVFQTLVGLAKSCRYHFDDWFLLLATAWAR